MTISGWGHDVVEDGPYPADWQDIRIRVRMRSGGRCECRGECGLHDGMPSGQCLADIHDRCAWARTCECYCHGPKPGDSTRCEERDGMPAIWARGTVILTTAHLCHTPQCANVDHLRHMCNRCHLRYDRRLHARHAAQRRHRERVGDGQTEMPW